MKAFYGFWKRKEKKNAFTLQVTESIGEWWIPGHTIERENDCERKSFLCSLQSSFFNKMWYQSDGVFMWHVKSISLTWCVARRWKKGEKRKKWKRKSSKWMLVLTNICLLNDARLSGSLFCFIFCPFYKVSAWYCVSHFFYGPYLYSPFTASNCTNCMDVWREPYSYMHNIPHFASLELLFHLFFA